MSPYAFFVAFFILMGAPIYSHFLKSTLPKLVFGEVRRAGVALGIGAT
jgi:hypothetical protein